MEFQVGYLALFLLFSVIQSFECLWMESQVWAGASSCYLELSDKLQKRICGTVSPSLAPSYEPLPLRRNVSSLSFFCRYYFGRCSSDLAQLVPLPFSRRRSDRLHYFSKCQKLEGRQKDVRRMPMSTVSSSHCQTLEFSAYRMLSFDL